MSLSYKSRTPRNSKLSKHEVQVNVQGVMTNELRSPYVEDIIQCPQTYPTHTQENFQSPVPRLKKLDSSRSSHSFYSLEIVKSLDSSSDIIGSSPCIVKLPQSPNTKLEDVTCSKSCISNTTTEDSIVDCFFSSSLPSSKEIAMTQNNSPNYPTSDTEIKNNTLFDVSAYIIKKKSLQGRQDNDKNCSTPHLDDLVNNKSVTAYKGNFSPAVHNPEQNMTDLLNVSEYDGYRAQKHDTEEKETTVSMFNENTLNNGTDDILDNQLLTKLTSQQSDIVYSFLLDCPKTSNILRMPSHYGSNNESKRQPANVSSDQLEHINKKTIYILHDGVCYPVSWYDDTCHNDIKEMIFCTCDSIVDSAFVLREVIVSNSTAEKENQNKVSEFNEVLFENSQLNLGSLTYTLGRTYEFVDFHLLSSKGVYKLEPSNKIMDFDKLRGNRFRRLRIRVNPFLHTESIRAINIMRKGANLLKHTKGGFPYLRQFQLSSDCERLLCYDSKDNQAVSVIFVKSIQGIRLGQNFTLLNECQLPALRHLSFTIYYDPSGLLPSTVFLNSFPVVTQALYQSLYITCKDETEFENWVCGLKALIFYHHQLPISKEELMNHSSKFEKKIYTAQGSCNTAVSQRGNVESLAGLNDCLELPFHSFSDLQTKYYRLSDNWLNLFEEIERFDKKFPNEYPKDLESIDSELNDSSLLCLGDFQKKILFDNDGEKYTPLLRIPTFENVISFKPLLSIFSPKQTYAADDRLEYIKMRELSFSSKKMLNDAAQRLCLEGLDACEESQKNKCYEEKNLQCINEILWKVQVDLENIHDMLQRLCQRRESEYQVNFFPKNFNVTEEILSFRKKFSSAITSIMPSFSYQKDNI